MLRPLRVHGHIECSQPASKSSWDSQDFGDISMVLKMAHFRKSTGPRIKIIEKSHHELPKKSLFMVKNVLLYFLHARYVLNTQFR